MPLLEIKKPTRKIFPAGYEEWVSEMKKFIATQKDKKIESMSNTDLSWQYNHELSIHKMTPQSKRNN